MKKISIVLIIFLVALNGYLLFITLDQHSASSGPVYLLPGHKIETRWYTAENKNAEKGQGGQANYGRKGSPNVTLLPGKTQVLANIRGSGTVRRMWFVLSKYSVKSLRGLRLQMFWDGSEKPAVDVPVGDFFCQSHGTMSTFENIFFSSPEGRSMNCFIPMPFKQGARIQVINESDEDYLLYYEIDVTKGDRHGKNMLYFHSYWHRENPTTMRKDFEILPRIKGKGRFLGCHCGIIQNPTTNHIWWGEGEYKVYLDGDSLFPTLCGTGTEDLIGSGYGQGKFTHLYQGNQYLSKEGDPEGVKPGGVVVFADRQGFYRFHVPDPIYFYKNIRVDIQVMGGGSFRQILEAFKKDPNVRLMKTGEPGHYWTKEELEKLPPEHGTTFERVDDYFGTAYWYSNNPATDLPPLVPYEKRIKDLI